MKTILMIGPFPPPAHGQSIATEALADGLEGLGFSVVRRNTGRRGYDKLLQHIAAAADIVRTRCTTYISLNANKGMWLSAILAAWARLLGRSIMLHHHSYSHIKENAIAAKALVFLAGPTALHIVLGKRMSAALRFRYPRVGRVMVLNNAGLITATAQPRDRVGSAVRLGFLGNITMDKGIDAALVSALACMEQDHRFELVIAGPVHDEEAARSIAQAKTHPSSKIQTLGPVYGEQKKNFYETIDILLFPSRYRNEASPLTIYEAMGYGVPVIATPLGCIPDDIGAKGGFVTSEKEYSIEAVPAIHRIAENINAASLSARSQYEDRVADYHAQVLALAAAI
jgi:glycosyltransferase involved in cell wall biosynthesis